MRMIWQFDITEETRFMELEKEFNSLEEAYAMVQFFRGDDEHEALRELQRPLFKDFRIEFYKVLEF